MAGDGPELAELKNSAIDKLEGKWEIMNSITDIVSEKNVIVGILENIEIVC